MKYVLTLILCLAMAGLAFAGNTATVTQVGTNDASVDQTGNDHTSTVDQYGTNYATVDQYGGNGNSADVDQGASGSAISDLGPPSYAGDWIGGAYVEQDGNSNSATIDINRGSAGARIYQQGDNNFGYQELNASHSRTTNWNQMGLHIEQVGDDNWANQKTVSSFGCFGIQGMIIDQQGYNNHANQYSKGGMSCTMEIYQNGSYNDDVVDLSALTCACDACNMAYAGKPAGAVTQYQWARFSTAKIDITGDYNHTQQCQEYQTSGVSGHHYAEMLITGNHNNAAQGQIGEFSYSYVSQNGDNNTAATCQVGDGTAEWNGNSATITQTGNGNAACVNQVLPYLP